MKRREKEYTIIFQNRDQCFSFNAVKRSSDTGESEATGARLAIMIMIGLIVGSLVWTFEGPLQFALILFGIAMICIAARCGN